MRTKGLVSSRLYNQSLTRFFKLTTMAGSTIVVAIDESSASRKALEWAMQYVYREGVELHLVTVMQPINYGEFERLYVHIVQPLPASWCSACSQRPSPIIKQT